MGEDEGRGGEGYGEDRQKHQSSVIAARHDPSFDHRAMVGW
jgi:hypothetical protein